MGYIQNIRKKVGHDAVMHPCASVIVVKDGKMLLQKRSDDHLWSYPGGAIEPGETPEEAAKRELLEETGLTAHSLRLMGVYGGEKRHHIYPNLDEVYTIDTVYICRDFSGELCSSDGESDELLFVDMNDIHNYSITSTVDDIINEFMKGI